MLELCGINKAWKAGTPDESVLFENFSLRVKKGEFVSVVGSNGSGKTTMLGVICGSVAADSGKVLLGGKDITALAEHKRYRRIGRVYQDPAMGTCPSLTIAENMALAEQKGTPSGLSFGINKKRIAHYRELLAPLGLGLEEKMNVKVGELSGGQRQAMALIMATMTPTDILILDEHTAALDPKTAEIIMHITRDVVESKGLTAVMVTHNLRYAVEYGGRLLMLHKGKIALDVCGEEKRNLRAEDVLGMFGEISGI